MKVSSTIGFEREYNTTLSIDDEEEFVEQAVYKLGPQPPNFEFDDAHIPEAVCIPMLSAGFGSKLAWLADRDQWVVFVGRG